MNRFILSLVVLWTAICPADPLASAGGNPPAAGTSAQDCLAVVVNKSNPVTDLSFADLRHVFLGEQTHWSGGHRITLVMREEGQPERAAVLRLIYRMTEADLNRYLLHASFRGDLRLEPKVLNSSLGVKRFVFNVPSAIGYLLGNETDETVKTIRIDGRLPGDDGYRLVVTRR